MLRYQSLCFLSPSSVLACSSWFSSFPLYVSVSVLFCSSPFISWWWLCYWRQDGNRQQLLPFSSSSLCRGASLCFSSSPSVSIALPLVSILFFLSFSGLLKMFQWLNCHALSFVPSGSQNLPVPFVFFNLLIVRPLSPLLSLYFLLVLSYSFFFFSSFTTLSLFSFFFFASQKSPSNSALFPHIYRQEERGATLPCLVMVQGRMAWVGFCIATPAAAGYGLLSLFFIMIACEFEYGLCQSSCKWESESGITGERNFLLLCLCVFKERRRPMVLFKTTSF